MIRMFSRHLLKGLWAMGLLLFFSLSLLGCDSQDLGETEADEPIEQDDPIVVDRPVSEACAVCHAIDNLAGVEERHKFDAGSIVGEIDGVTVDDSGGDVKMTVEFSLQSLDGAPYTGLAGPSMRLAVTQLVPPPMAGDASFWRSYFNRTEPREPQDGEDYVVQATTISPGEVDVNFENGMDGSYLYTVSLLEDGPVNVPYREDYVHRVAIQVDDNKENFYHDFRPDGLPFESRRVAATSSRSECHHDMGFHDGDNRKDVFYCVTCHNPGSTDLQSGNSLDMKVMIHKIHRGANLPSVKDGDSYVIYGYRNSLHDYSDVHLPMDIRNCTKCHDGGDPETPNGDNWKTVPTKDACGSCHDNISFEEPVPDGMKKHYALEELDLSSNFHCANCHEKRDIVEDHRVPLQAAKASFRYNILAAENTAPGLRPEITFSVTDPTNGDSPYDIRADDPFTVPDGASRLAVLIGWNTENYNNLGSGNHPAQPISIDALTEAVRNSDGSFTVTSPVSVPADATGSGTVALEGHPAVDSDGDGVYDRIPVKNVFEDFGITDEIVQPRRAVVDIEACNVCHESLSVHGSNRTDEPQVCVICHNGNATDINQRPEDPSLTADGRVEQAIDFKFIIHGIHGAADREEDNPLVIYGFGGREHVFNDSQVHYPGKPENCYACHYAGTIDLTPDIQTTTVGTGDDIADPADDRYATPVAITCGACHDDEDAVLHIQQNGGGFDLGPPVQPSDDGDEDDDGGEEIIQPPGHPTSPNCTTAFECHG